MTSAAVGSIRPSAAPLSSLQGIAPWLSVICFHPLFLISWSLWCSKGAWKLEQKEYNFIAECKVPTRWFCDNGEYFLAFLSSNLPREMRIFRGPGANTWLYIFGLPYRVIKKGGRTTAASNFPHACPRRRGARRCKRKGRARREG